jgi:pyrroline-5-carboxylate reductase
MQNPTIGFVGGGRIVSIMLGGWERAGVMPAGILVSDPNEGVLSALKAAHRGVQSAGADSAKAAGQEIVFLAVHPPAFKEVLPVVRGALKPNALVVSLAPKFSIGKIGEMLGEFGGIARVIPNAPSIVGAGYNPMAFGAAVSAAQREWLGQLLRPLGECPEVAESKLEAYAILTAMGPTYFWYQMYELLARAEAFGLTAGEAQEGLVRMMTGALETMNRSGLSAEQVKDLIPVKPLAELEASVAEAYRSKLTALMEKIRP